MKRRIKKVAGLSVALGVGLASAASLGMPPAANAATGPAWHLVKAVSEGRSSAFTAVLATGPTSGWVFQSNNGRPAAYQRAGSALKQVAFPSVPNEIVFAAAESSPSNEWAFAWLPNGDTEAVKLVHGRWEPVKTLGGVILSASVLANNDVTVFGPLGTYHFNGCTWTREFGDVAGGDSVAATDDWMYDGVTLYHLDGHTKKTFDLARLLPLPNGLNSPRIDGVLALTDRNVYVIGNGEAQDAGGPIVILHYNGSTWKKVAQYGTGNPGQPSYDGHGGFWLPAGGGGISELLHYSGGKLVTVTLPGSDPRPPAITAVSRIPGTAGQLAVGNTPPPDSTANPTGELLQYR